MTFDLPSPGLEPPHHLCDRRSAMRAPSARIDTCLCGEPLGHEAERDAGQCWDCMADEAGFQLPEPEIQELLTRAQIDQLCGITHRRRAS